MFKNLKSACRAFWAALRTTPRQGPQTPRTLRVMHGCVYTPMHPIRVVGVHLMCEIDDSQILVDESMCEDRDAWRALWLEMGGGNMRWASDGEQVRPW